MLAVIMYFLFYLLPLSKYDHEYEDDDGDDDDDCGDDECNDNNCDDYDDDLGDWDDCSDRVLLFKGPSTNS